MPVIYDIESGFPYEVSQDYYDQYMEFMNQQWLAARVNIDYDFKGKVLIYGTTGSLDSLDEMMFRDMFLYGETAFSLRNEETTAGYNPMLFYPVFQSTSNGSGSCDAGSQSTGDLVD